VDVELDQSVPLAYFYLSLTLVAVIFRLVEETLEPLDPDRRAFRLVGGVLVERTVKEVLPSVKQNRENLEQVITTMSDRLTTKQKETAELKAKYNLTES
jgi:prefoldin subunit 2